MKQASLNIRTACLKKAPKWFQKYIYLGDVFIVQIFLKFEL